MHGRATMVCTQICEMATCSCQQYNTHPLWRMNIIKWLLYFSQGCAIYRTRGGWKRVIKAHVQALIASNFAESANFSSLTQQFLGSAARLYWPIDCIPGPLHGGYNRARDFRDPYSFWVTFASFSS